MIRYFNMTRNRFNRSDLSEVMSYEAWQQIEPILVGYTPENKYFQGNPIGILTQVSILYLRSKGYAAEYSGIPRTIRSHGQTLRSEIHTDIDKFTLIVIIPKDYPAPINKSMSEQACLNAGFTLLYIRTLDELITHLKEIEQ